MPTPTIVFSDKNQHFEYKGTEDISALIASMDMPLSMTLQLTQGSNIRGIYHPQILKIRTRSYREVPAMIDKLSGIRRIIISGGEPTLHRRFWSLLDYTRERFEKVVISTDATRITRENVGRLKALVDYIDINIDGPRKQHDNVHGNYDEVMRGLIHIASAGIPFSIICTYIPCTHIQDDQNTVHYVCQTGDALGAIKVKILTPIPNTRSVDVIDSFVTEDRITRLRSRLAEEKEKNGWKINITIMDWIKVGQGHAILVEPDGRIIASPVWDREECVLPLGNLAESTIQELWQAYPYKENHLKKYLRHTIDSV